MKNVSDWQSVELVGRGNIWRYSHQGVWWIRATIIDEGWCLVVRSGYQVIEIVIVQVRKSAR